MAKSETGSNIIGAVKNLGEETLLAIKRDSKKKFIFLCILIFLSPLVVYIINRHLSNSTETIQNRKTIHFDSTKYNILILSFNNPDDAVVGKSDVGEDLAIKLKQNKKYDTSKIDVEYLPCDTIVRSSNMARIISKKIKNTSIVIWGTDSKPPDSSHQIYFHYTNLISEISNTSIPDEGVTEKFETYRLSNITEGEMHLEIEDIINWFLANYYLNKCNYIQAINSYKEIEKYSENLNYDLYFSLAYCYAKMDSLQKAKYYCEKSLETNPNPNLFAVQTYYGLILEQIDTGEASIYYAKLLKSYPSNNYIQSIYSDIIRSQHIVSYEISKYYNGALKIHSENFILQIYYAEYLANRGAFDEAKKHYILALKIDSNCAFVYFDYARLLWLQNNNNINKVKKLYKKGLKLCPLNAWAHQTYAYFLLESGDIVNAKRQFKIASQIDPSYIAEDHFLYSQFLLFYLHNYEGAKDQYLKAIKLNPKLRSTTFENYYGIE